MTDRPPFDAFISYRQRGAEMAWVRGPLRRALGDAGLRVLIDFEQFRLGAPVITEMERGVLASAYTLAVATPAYLETSFPEFENLLSQQLSLEGVAHRLIVLMREPCELPLRLRYKLWLGMSSDQEVEDNMPRLIAALSAPPL